MKLVKRGFPKLNQSRYLPWILTHFSKLPKFLKASHVNLMNFSLKLTHYSLPAITKPRQSHDQMSVRAQAVVVVKYLKRFNKNEVLIFPKLVKVVRVKCGKNILNVCVWSRVDFCHQISQASYLPAFCPLLCPRSRQRPSSHRQAGGGDQTHPERTSIPCRPSSDHRPHKGTTPARCLLETSKWCVEEKFPKPTCSFLCFVASRSNCTPNIVYFPSSKPQFDFLDLLSTWMREREIVLFALPHTSYTPAWQTKCRHCGLMWYFQQRSKKLHIVFNQSKTGNWFILHSVFSCLVEGEASSNLT